MLLFGMIFACCLVVAGACGVLWHRTEEEKKSRKLARSIAAGLGSNAYAVKTTVLISPADDKQTQKPFFARMGYGKMDEESGQRRKRFLAKVAMTLAGGVAGLALNSFIGPLGLAGGMAVGFIVPRTIQKRKDKKRLAAFEELFPEALDFLARSVRAGNALSMCLELLGSETADPLKTEIVKVNRELALGEAMEDALNNLIERVPLVEVRFFASTILLQRDTGGNLAEVLMKLSVSLRERSRLRGHVRAASEQGRLTATVLTILPIVTLVLLRTVSPDYLSSLTDDQLGRTLLGAAAASQVVGYLVMKKIINFEV